MKERTKDMKITNEWFSEDDWLSPVWFFAPLLGFALGMAVSLAAIWWL